MANPATLMLIMGVGGTVMSAVSQYREAQNQAAVARKKEAIARAEAERGREISKEVAREQRKEKRKAVARAIVLYAKSGVKVVSPTAGLVTTEIERRMERKAQITQERGVADWQLGMSQADIYGQQARDIGRVAPWRMGATLATGLSSAALSYYIYKPKTEVQTLGTTKKTSDKRTIQRGLW